MKSTPGMCALVVLCVCHHPICDAARDQLSLRNHFGIENNTTNLKYLGFYGCDPTTQSGWASLCISRNLSVFAEAKEGGMDGMASVIWAFFRNAVSVYQRLHSPLLFCAWAQGCTCACVV